MDAFELKNYVLIARTQTRRKQKCGGDSGCYVHTPEHFSLPMGKHIKSRPAVKKNH